ncbi:helix-turn-helix transcriptional regulator [Nonomuraea sp. NPDC048916]|uniref:helix-turn-helix domain-containing protein n=1 Tax=Nonomuraea sp. NPDC048916 TaxID=3154232 RepID=UPI003403FC7A
MINSDKIKQRLSELGIDAHEFRARAGISIDVLDDGPALATISAETVMRICEVLEIELAELLGRPRPAGPHRPDEDDLVIEAALARHGQFAATDLARALNWPFQRVEQAIQALTLRLLGTALQVVRAGDRVRLEARPALLDAETQTRLHAAEQAQIPLSAQEAVVVLQLLHHHHNAVPDPLPLDAETISVLLHRRFAIQDRTDLQPHVDISFSMGLKALPEIPGRHRAKPSGGAGYRSRS